LLKLDLEEMAYKDIAEVAGVPIGTVDVAAFPD